MNWKNFLLKIVLKKYIYTRKKGDETLRNKNSAHAIAFL